MRHALWLAVLTAGCLRIGPAPPGGLLPMEQQAWWDRLRALCGGSFAGRLVERGSSDERYRAGPLAARVVRCPRDTVQIAFDVGAERTRSWEVTRAAGGLRLRHLNQDAGPDTPSGYGGRTRWVGSVRQQDFPADSATARMLPAAAENVWSLEIDPGRTLAYTLGRPGIRQRFRVEFALPPPP